VHRKPSVSIDSQPLVRSLLIQITFIPDADASVWTMLASPGPPGPLASPWPSWPSGLAAKLQTSATLCDGALSVPPAIDLWSVGLLLAKRSLA
jgi:hypothetical protein